MVFLFISLLLIFFYTALIIYYRQSWVQLKNYYSDLKHSNSTFISVIIVARNEEKNIGNCIKSIMNQTYPASLYELIIIDDHSTDSTATIVNSFIQNSSLKVSTRIFKLEEFNEYKSLNSYKKKAIENAINLAKGSLVVTTDADCIAKPCWLQTIASYYEEFRPVFIAAPVVYMGSKKNDTLFKRFFKAFQSLDFITLQGITGASVYKKFHSMCNGANLAYEKKIFYEAGGFEGIDSIASGDDMLLMHKIQKLYPDKISYIKSPDVIITTQPAETLKDFINQRIRWASKADRYTDKKITAVLFFVYIFNAWIFIIAICSLFVTNIFWLFIALIFTKTIVEFFFLSQVAAFFNKQQLLWLFLPAQPFHIIYTLIVGWLGKFGIYEWKGRKVK